MSVTLLGGPPPYFELRMLLLASALASSGLFVRTALGLPWYYGQIHLKLTNPLLCLPKEKTLKLRLNKKKHTKENLIEVIGMKETQCYFVCKIKGERAFIPVASWIFAFH